ncbi:sensor histidine kinase [Devosia sediminis]|uniref:histidine kinase n=1 Tax=Devosia sediminis TaxID=2798801 RepID=A0A934IWB4_9HYPH|nr:sensor domain-containing protein [Devosia sediminis]MBJ3783104.1 sensor domain-containing protein [Devosia sediminis]
MPANPLFNRQRWLMVPRQSLFLLAALPLAVTVPTLVITLISLGAGLLVLGIGFVILVVAATLSRWFGLLELERLAWTGAVPIEPPDWPRSAKPGLIASIMAVLTDRHQWSYIAYSVLYLFLGTITGSLALTWLSAIAVGATRWLWVQWVPTTIADISLLALVFPAVRTLPTFLHEVVVNTYYALICAGALVTLPWVVDALVSVHDRLARLFLARYSPEEIDEQMAGLRRSRQASVAAEGRALRRLERDLHDGPQQQLLRLQLDLASARRRIASDPEAATRLIDDAARRSAETLTELRHLVRGIAPPILQDRGLAAALQALAERNPIPATVTTAIDPAAQIEPAVQQGVYFVVAELMANAVKHSKAKRVTIDCRTDTSTRSLALTILDDGKGGAKQVPGHGLAGIAERIEGLGGAWSLDSPVGGPTRVTVQVPI